MFVRPDGWTFGVHLAGDDPTDCAPATLLRQLRRALAVGPQRRRGESDAAYRERFSTWDAGFRRRGY